MFDEESGDALSQPRGDEDYLGLFSKLAESLRAVGSGPAIFNT
jgi:hypothetical protein